MFRSSYATMLRVSGDTATVCLLVAMTLAVAAPLEARLQTERAVGPRHSAQLLERAVEEAEDALRAGEMDLAESRYRSALSLGWLLLGRIERAAEDQSAARAAFEAATHTTLEVREAKIELARTLGDLGLVDEAEVVWRSLLSADPADFEVRRLFALALGEAGRLQDAVQELEQLVAASSGDPEHSFLLATAYLKADRIEDAGKVLDQLVSTLPSPSTFVLVGRALRDGERYGEAREALAKALEIEPTARRAHYYLGTVALLEEGSGALELAAAAFRAELENYPDDHTSHLYLGMALAEKREFAASLSHLEHAAELESVRPEALRYLGRSLYEVGRFEEAVEASLLALAQIKDLEGNDLSEPVARLFSNLHYQLGQALRALGQGDAARRHFDDAKRYQARSAEGARETLATYLQERSPETVVTARPSSELTPQARRELLALRNATVRELARTYRNLGVLYVRSYRDHRGGAELLSTASDLAPDLEGIHYALGVALFSDGRYEEATIPLSRALEEAADEDDPSLERMLALAYLNSGSPDRAARLLEGLPGRAADPQLQYAFGLALNRAGRASDASGVFLELLREHSDWPELHVVLGQALAAQGDFAGALGSLERALALDPRVAEAHATVAEIHLRRGELPEAEAQLRRELAHHPGDNRATFTLATVLDLSQQPEQAVEILQSLLARDPESARARALLGRIMLTSGELELAREQLEAAIGLAPTDAESHYHLGQLYQRLGRRDAARLAFDEYRRLKDEARSSDEGR